MPSLKDLRIRKDSVSSTKKITLAMKMIAAAKMRKAEQRVENSKVYADLMSRLMTALIKKAESFDEAPRLLVGSGRQDRHLIIMITSDRGLCGGFNSSVGRKVVAHMQDLEKDGANAKVICVGRRGRDLIQASPFRKSIVETYTSSDKPKFWQAKRISNKVQEMFNADEIDVCTIVYNRFISVISQELTKHQLIPYTPLFPDENNGSEEEQKALHSIYEYEPSEVDVLHDLLPQNLSSQIYRALLENAASEHGARMTAMDSATRNAEDMIKGLELEYNRTRQAIVTKELIEIISGAEAL